MTLQDLRSLLQSVATFGCIVNPSLSLSMLLLLITQVISASSPVAPKPSWVVEPGWQIVINSVVVTGSLGPTLLCLFVAGGECFRQLPLGHFELRPF